MATEMNDLYGSDSSMPEDSAPPAEEQETETEGDNRPQLINSEICPGMEVGDEFTVRVTGVKDGEYLVEYSPAPSEAEEPPEPGMGEGSAPAPAMSEYE